MPHTPEEQSKDEPVVEKAVVKTPEVLLSPHDILDKEYEFNGVSFTTLGMEPEFFDDNETAEDLQPGTVAIINIQKQRVPVIPFQGGMARITKIRIGDEVIVGYREIINNILIVEQAPQGWMTEYALEIELGVCSQRIEKRVDYIRQFHTEWFHDYRNNGGRIFEYYSPELCEIIRKKIFEEVQPPEGWMTRMRLSKELNISDKTVAYYADLYRQSHPEWFHNYKSQTHFTEHYSPELCDFIRNEMNNRKLVPEGWMTCNVIAHKFRLGYTAIMNRADNHRQSHPEWFHNYKAQNKKMYEYFSPELCNIIRQEMNDKRS